VPRIKLLALVIPALVVVQLSCSLGGPPPETMADLARDYVYTTLSMSPSTATQVGYHVHQGKTLDDKLDGYGKEDLEALRAFLVSFRARLSKAVPDPSKLDVEQRADYDIVTQNMALTEWELYKGQMYRHNPTVYVELAGSALFNLYMLKFDTQEKRYGSIISRLKQMPLLMSQAQANLVDSPEIWRKVAQQENEGNIQMIEGDLQKDCPPSLRPAYDSAMTDAKRAFVQFNAFLENELSKSTSDWRLGKEKYAAKFGPALGLNVTPEAVLADAEKLLEKVRHDMFALAQPLYRKNNPGAPDTDLDVVVKKTLDKIAESHATPETYKSTAQKDLEDVRSFVKTSGLVKLPPRDNLQVIDTPEFMRGIYSVGGFNSAPALEPQLGAFYWLTPIPPDMEKARMESKLREYNDYGLRLLTIHEAIPGHYLQLEYSNDIEPKSRRLLRSVFGNGPYVEGWAVYATEATLDAGYLNNSPELRLTFMKQQLRMIANTIIDVRLQTMNMQDQEAIDLMIKRTFQEKEEATGKLQRAKLSSTQLCTYFTGWREWRRILDAVKAKEGAAFNLASFHERALKAGAVPLPSVERMLLNHN